MSSAVPLSGAEHGVPLRRRLFLLTAAGILPLTVFAGIGLYVLRRQQSAEAERVGIELARSVANAVDSELGSVSSVLEVLATTPTLDRPDLDGFRERAMRVISAQHDWAAIVLTRVDGSGLSDTRFPHGSALPPVAEMQSFDRVIGMRRPVVGSLTQHSQIEWLFAVRVPVVRDGVVRYVVTALIRPERIRQVLARQGVPDDWVISIVDENGRRVARSRAHKENLGGRLSDTVQEVVARGGTHGAGVAYSLEGGRIFTPYSRLQGSRWTAVLGLPTAVVDAAARRSLAIYGGGVLLSIAIGAAGALWAVRSITRPIAELRAAAEALGRKEMPIPPQTSIKELREVGVALKTAAIELARAETEREELLRKERQAREAAEAADRAKDEFMAVLSHELRTPLNAVFGWAKWLQTGLNDQAMIARATDAIARNAHIQVQLVDDLLDLARITSGKMRLDVSSIDVRNVLEAAIDAVRPAADAKAITLESSIGTEPCVVTADPARLQQVVWNLLMNAVKFTPNSGNVRLALQRAESQIQIVVSDTGQGIAPAVLPHIFERFRQADSSSTRSHGGLGLGLALVKHFVELHGGSVVAQSAGEGCGTTVVISLPTARPPADLTALLRRPAAPLASQKGVGRTELLHNVRVLVADDDKDAILLVATILREAGADVQTASSADATFELLRLWRPDVLVSDIGMPGEDGYSLIARIRASGAEQGSATPAVALSAYGRPEDRVRALAAGFNMHVPKPVDPGELTAIVADLARLAGLRVRPNPAN